MVLQMQVDGFSCFLQVYAPQANHLDHDACPDLEEHFHRVNNLRPRKVAMVLNNLQKSPMLQVILGAFCPR